MSGEQKQNETLELYKEDNEKKQILFITKWGSLLFAGICLLFAVFNYLEQNYFMAGVSGVISLYMLLCLGIVRLTGKAEKAIGLITIFVIALMTMYIVTGESEGTTILWIMVIPPYAFFVMSNTVAMLTCSILFAELALFMWTPWNAYIYDYGHAFLVRVPILYAVQILGTFLIKLQSDRAKKRQKEMLELALKYKTDAENSSRAKSEFLSRMSHEIRTPLNAIIGMNEMIHRESGSETVSEYSYKIKKSSEMLLGLINDILDISKIEAGKVELIEENYDVFSLLTDCYHVNRERAKKKGLKLEFSCDEHFPKVIYGDMTRVRQIALNLISNAVKYTHEGSVKVEVSGERQEETVQLKIVVRDTGIGMTKENLDRLFLKFERFDLEQNQSIEGTGLGMNITRELVTLMHGQISVASEYGKGTEFTVIIPQQIIDASETGKFTLKEDAKHSIQQKYYSRFTAPEAKILVVDDVEINLEVIANLLKITKVKMDLVTSGKQCLEMVKENTYDVIFMDHMMAEMNGIETLKNMQELKQNRSSAAPVIMLTANALAGEKEKYLKLGFADYLSKPVRGEKLESMLLKYLPKSKVLFKESEIKEEAADQKKVTGEYIKEQLPEIQLETALMYCADSMEFLNNMLQQFAQNGRREKLDKLFECKDWENYRIEVHSLKGTSLTMGLDELSEKARKLEMAAREGQITYIEEHHQELAEHLEKVNNSIMEIFR